MHRALLEQLKERILQVAAAEEALAAAGEPREARKARKALAAEWPARPERPTATKWATAAKEMAPRMPAEWPTRLTVTKWTTAAKEMAPRMPAEQPLARPATPPTTMSMSSLPYPRPRIIAFRLELILKSPAEHGILLSGLCRNRYIVILIRL
jgi:hypothetical protein